MTKARARALVLALLLPCPAMAQSVFDGAWKADLGKTPVPTKPDLYLLQAGLYQCKSCVPPVAITADGEDHAVAGNPYYDVGRIFVVDGHTIDESYKKNGATVITFRASVSPDGNTLTYEFRDRTASNAALITGTGDERRVTSGPPGSHLISGAWRPSMADENSDAGLTVTYKIEGNSVTLSSPSGQGYTAKLDGTDAPYIGDPGTTSVSVRQLGTHTLEETDKRNGKVVSVVRSTVSADGKIMTVVFNDRLRGTTNQYVAIKQ